MAGQVTASVVQLGDSGTATQNFVVRVPAAPDGTMRIARGNAGAESADILTVSSAGAAGFADGTVGAPGIAFGSDPDNGAYRIGANNWALACAGAKVMEFAASGAVTMPLQPAFSAYNSSTRSNVTGSGTTYTVPFDTEIIDRGANFASNTFTAPITGAYNLNAAAMLQELGTSSGFVELNIITSNRTYSHQWSAVARTNGQEHHSVSTVADMDAGDTAYVTTRVTAMAGDTVDVYGTSNPWTRFSGHLAC